MTRRSLIHLAFASGLPLILIGACVQPGVGTQPASAPSAGSTATASPAPSSTAGIGVSRAVVMAAIDAVLMPLKIRWQAETVSRNGTPSVTGDTTFTGAPYLTVGLEGPADDLRSITTIGTPAESVGEAAVARAIVHTSAPAAEDWFSASFATEPAFLTASFGRVNVAWNRDFLYLHGYHLSSLTVTTLRLPAPPTPEPTPSPTPARTQAPDPMSLLPTSLAGVAMTRQSFEGSEVPDGFPGCAPVCRREVDAFARQLGVAASSLDVAIARPAGTQGSSPSIAIVRVGPEVAYFAPPGWHDAMKTIWPNMVMTVSMGSGPSVFAAQHERPADRAVAPTWYLASGGNLVFIVSVPSADIRADPPAVVTDLFRTFPLQPTVTH